MDADKAYRNFIKRLTYYYGGKVLPAKQAVDIWVEELTRAKIDPKSMDQIFDVVKQGKMFPSNLPYAVIEAARGNNTQIYNPGQDKNFCADSCDLGLLFVKRLQEDGTWEQSVFRCLKCKTANHAFPAAYASDLKSYGWTHYDVHNDPQLDQYNQEKIHANQFQGGNINDLRAKVEQVWGSSRDTEDRDREW